MSVLKKLTEGIVNRDLGKEGGALLSKWERTGLLEGLDNDNSRSTMARLLRTKLKSYYARYPPWLVVMSKVLLLSHFLSFDACSAA